MKEEIKIIDSYGTLPIGKYLDILEICKGKIDADALEQQVAILQVLTGLTEDELLALPISEYAQLTDTMRFLYSEEKRMRRVASSYALGEWVLIPTMDLRKITTAQYIDFQTFAKEGDARLVEMISCYLVPKGMKYNEGYDVIEVQRAIREHLCVSDVLALSAFFLKQYAALIRSSLSYSERMTARLNERAQKAVVEKVAAIRAMLSRISGDGLPT